VLNEILKSIRNERVFIIKIKI